MIILLLNSVQFHKDESPIHCLLAKFLSYVHVVHDVILVKFCKQKFTLLIVILMIPAYISFSQNFHNGEQMENRFEIKQIHNYSISWQAQFNTIEKEIIPPHQLFLLHDG